MTIRTGANPHRTKRLVRISAMLFAAGALAVAGAAALASPVAADPGNGQGQGQEQAVENHQDAVENHAQGQDNGNNGQEKYVICHVVQGKGETKAGYNVIEIAVPAWSAHQVHGDWVITAEKPCPPVTTPPTPPPTPPVTPSSGPEAGTTVVTPEAAAVTAVEPATVAAPQPAKVAKPTAATMPGRVPAGDGSSNADFTPLLGLTAAAGMVAAVSATRLRKVPTR